MIPADTLRTISLSAISQPPQQSSSSQKNPARCKHDPTRDCHPALPFFHREMDLGCRWPVPNLEATQPRPNHKIGNRPKDADHYWDAVSHPNILAEASSLLLFPARRCGESSLPRTSRAFPVPPLRRLL